MIKISDEMFFVSLVSGPQANLKTYPQQQLLKKNHSAKYERYSLIPAIAISFKVFGICSISVDD